MTLLIEWAALILVLLILKFISDRSDREPGGDPDNH